MCHINYNSRGKNQKSSTLLRHMLDLYSTHKFIHLTNVFCTNHIFLIIILVLSNDA